MPNPAARCLLYQHINNRLQQMTPAGYTATSGALRLAYEILLNSRTNSKKAVIVLTDGVSNIGDPPVRVAHEIHSLRWDQSWNTSVYGPQVEIYALGIEGADREELNLIASDLPNHVSLMPTFSAFERLARDLHWSGLLLVFVVLSNIITLPSKMIFLVCMILWYVKTHWTLNTWDSSAQHSSTGGQINRAVR